MADDVNMKLCFQHDEDVLLHHVILPRVLPQEESESLYQTEIDLMRKMVKTVKDLDTFLPSKTVEFFERLERTHLQCTKENISHEINELRPGDTFAIFMSFERTTFMIHVPLDGHNNDVQNVIVSTFPIYMQENDFEVIFDIFYKF